MKKTAIKSDSSLKKSVSHIVKEAKKQQSSLHTENEKINGVQIYKITKNNIAKKE
ncbi:MAG: hypothetical protein ACOX2F_12700 [bacterium]